VDRISGDTIRIILEPFMTASTMLEAD